MKKKHSIYYLVDHSLILTPQCALHTHTTQTKIGALGQKKTALLLLLDSIKSINVGSFWKEALNFIRVAESVYFGWNFSSILVFIRTFGLYKQKKCQKWQIWHISGIPSYICKSIIAKFTSTQ